MRNFKKNWQKVSNMIGYKKEPLRSNAEQRFNNLQIVE